jgi:hypothetical protein
MRRFPRDSLSLEEKLMNVEGQCHCGRIAYEAAVEPDTVGICHCTDCQTLTGSAFRAVISAPAASFKLLRGEPRVYIKTADSGTRRAHTFCGDCGTPIYAAAISDPPSYSLRVGTIKQRAQLRPTRQIWCRSALPWAMDLRAIEKFDAQP